MKKIIISIATISVFIFTSCFTDTDTATVKINLRNIPVAKTAKIEKKSIIDRFVALFLKEAVAQPVVPLDTNVSVVHLGAFDANNQLLAKDSIIVTGDPNAENTVVEFDVPAGIRRKIVVLGEIQIEGEDEPDSDNFIDYYGIRDEIELIAGENKEVTINMMHMYEGFLDEYLNLQNGYLNSSEPATWAHIVGASKYNIYKENDNYYELIEEITDITETKYLGTSKNYYNLRIYFDFAEIESNNIYFAIC